MNALAQLVSVLCDPSGKCCIHGSEADRQIIDDALAAIRAELVIAQPVQPARRIVRHKFWGAGEPDCPEDIKAGNGELHTMRCKIKPAYLLGNYAKKYMATVMCWGSKSLKTVPYCTQRLCACRLFF